MSNSKSGSVAYIFDNLGPHLNVTGASRALFFGGKQSQLGVKVDSMDGVHWNAPRRFTVLVVVGDQHLHVRAIDHAPIAYCNHA